MQKEVAGLNQSNGHIRLTPDYHTCTYSVVMMMEERYYNSRYGERGIVQVGCIEGELAMSEVRGEKDVELSFVGGNVVVGYLNTISKIN